MKERPLALGCIPDEYDRRDFLFDSVIYEGSIADSVDWSGIMSPVKDQKHRGSCVAFATCAAKERQEATKKACNINLSEEWMYRFIAQPGGGSYMRDAMKLLKTRGVPIEKLMKYDEKETDRNTPYMVDKGWLRKYRRALGNARMHRAKGYVRLHTIYQILQTLSEDGPVAIGIPWYEGWFSPTHKNKEGYPVLSNKNKGLKTGHHAVCIVGYRRDDYVFVIRNSWGDKWGKDGYAYLKFNAIGRHFDCWATFDYKWRRVKRSFKFVQMIKIFNPFR